MASRVRTVVVLICIASALFTSVQADESSTSRLTLFPGKSAAIARILEKKKIRIGMQKDYHPFHFANPAPDRPGIDVEIVQSLARELNVETEITYGDIPELMRMIQRNELDMALGGISASLPRAKYVAFTDPYLISSMAALVAIKSTTSESQSLDFRRQKLRGLSDLQNLPGLLLGVRENTTTEEVLRGSRFSQFRVKTYLTHEALMNGLMSGEIDAMVGDQIHIAYLIAQRPDLLNKFLPLLKPYGQDHLCIMFAQGDAEFANYLNFFIKEMTRSGALDAIRQKYAGSDGVQS
ncbi:MAG: amino acid ABC transporter substrate-binding protein [Leptospirales bacterium]|nr:amino acid ABC transporter substrate-binding protein [Leptospirales bacterium]